MHTPTREAYGELQQAFDHFNQRLFDGALPPCLITLQREKRCYGYFSAARFVKNSDRSVATDEIALNPSWFGVLPVIEVLQTVGHELVHLWQHHFGKPGRGRYHNLEWAAKMEAIGLMPSDTGKPGGKKTGDHMQDYVIQGGRFDQACQELMATGFAITWLDRYPAASAAVQQILGGEAAGQRLAVLGLATPPPTRPFRTKYSHRCGAGTANLWGRAGLEILCGQCGEKYAPARGDVASEAAPAVTRAARRPSALVDRTSTSPALGLS
jgi:hypothetical protein